MRSLAAAIAALSALASIACEPVRRDVELSWTFDGKSCAEAGVANIRVYIDGEVLDPDTFACSSGGNQVNTGVALGRFLLGRYDFTVQGLDAGGNAAYQGVQTFRVADVAVNRFSLDATAGAGVTGAELSWTFDGKTCAQAGVDVVHISLDGTPITDDRNNPDIPCSQNGRDGATIDPLTPGAHTFDLTGLVGSTAKYSLTGLQVTVPATGTVQVAPDLLSASSALSSASLTWTFAGMSCAAAKVDKVQVLVDDQDAGTVACSSGGLDGAVVTDITPGDRVFKLQASRTVPGGELLVYELRAGVSAHFVANRSAALVLDAPSATPGRGGVALRWKFPAGGPDCTTTTGAGVTVSYLLRDPSGAARPAQTASCGGAAGGTGIAFCNPAAGGCAAGDTGLTAGNWTVSAGVAGTPAYSATLVFGVPNAASSSFDVALR